MYTYTHIPFHLGDGVKNINLDYVESETISSAANPMHYNVMQSYYRSKFKNNGLKILLITLSTDKTELVRGSRRSAWPIYLTIMNFNEETLRRDDTQILVGFIPKLSYGDEKLKNFMHESGITSDKNKKYSLTVLNRWLETESMKAILAPIMEANLRGPIRLLIDQDEYDTMPVFHNFTGSDYEKYTYVCINTHIYV